MVEVYLKILESINILDELKSIAETKQAYDYMECCALEKVNQDILSGRKVDWTAADNVRRLENELFERLDALETIGKGLFEDVISFLSED